METYITLDGNKYEVANLAPERQRGCNIRLNLDGTVDSTFGPGVMAYWGITLYAANTPAEGYGDPDDLRATYDKVASVNFTDMEGGNHSVVIAEKLVEQSMTPLLDDAANIIMFALYLVKVG